MSYLQKLYFPALNRLFSLTGKIDEKWRMLITEVCFGVLSLMTVVYCSADPSLVRSVFSLFLLAVITVMSVREPLKEIKIPKLPDILWTLFSLCMLVAAIDPNAGDPDFAVSAIMIPFVLPALYLVWAGRGDFDTLFGMLCRPLALVYTLYCIALFFIAPYNDPEYMWTHRYLGTATHPNYLGLLMLAGIVSCVYLVLTSKKTAVKIVSAAGAVLMTMFMTLSNSRTALVSVAAVVFAAFLYSLLRKEKIAAISSVVLLAAIFLTFFFSYKYTVYSAKMFDAAELAKQNAAVSAAVSASEANSASADAAASAAPAAAAPAAELIINGRMSGGTLDSILSDRPNVWRSYIKHVGFRGHALTGNERIDLTGTLSRAHNQYLDNAFSMGIINAVSELIFDLTALGYAAVWMFKKDGFKGYKLFMTLSAAAFFLSCLCEYVGSPVNKGLTLLYFIAVVPMFAPTGKSEKTAN